jgi:hypothetical protein
MTRKVVTRTPNLRSRTVEPLDGSGGEEPRRPGRRPFRRMIRWAGWAMVGVAVAGAAGSALAAPPPKPTPAEQCEAKKKEAAGAKAQCRAEEHAKEVLGQTPDFARCEAAFTKAFAKAEQEAGPGVCPTEGDTSTIETLVDVCMSDIGSALAGSPPPPASCVPGGAPGYADNGDGTITDHATGLTWEKKDDDAGIHDVGLRYSWGDAILVHVAALNSPPCFAGHGGCPTSRSWRASWT